MYNLHSLYKITKAQQLAVDQLADSFKTKDRQVLLGVTGSGKTFTMANLIQKLNLPTLVLSPNKTLAAQLYQEFKGFFPENRVGYFISYYDYYQPEAYIPHRNLYIAKEVSINPELERLRIDAARNILESKYTIIVASVSAIYSIGSPDDFFSQKISCDRFSRVERDFFVRELVSLGYSRTEDIIERGKFRVRGDVVEIFPTSEEDPLRFFFENAQINGIETFDSITAEQIKPLSSVNIFPINYFYYKQDRINSIIYRIKQDLEERIDFFKKQGKEEYAERLMERTQFDIEMLEQYGFCPGIENYSLYLTGRKRGEPPYTLLDFFGQNYLVIMDESHITVPQLNAMYAGDQSRKHKLVEYGFRLPTALDNRPLNFEEINVRLDKVLYVSATPSEYELRDTDFSPTELLVRPTGLLDPEIEIRQSDSPIEDMIAELESEIDRKNRILVTTLTKRMAEKLTDYLLASGIKSAYLHSEIKPLDRVKVIKKLRAGEFDVLVGINLLREGLDLPEVSLVVVLDADREGYLRSETSLIQTFGRAARHINGRVILYVQKMNDSVRAAIDESARRRAYQVDYNKMYGIIPRSIVKTIKDFYDDDYWLKKSEEEIKDNFKDKESLVKEIENLTGQMKKRAADLDFKGAAVLRERIKFLKNMMLELY